MKNSFNLTFIGLKPVFVTTNMPFGRAFNSSAVIIRFFFHKITSSFMIFSFTRYFFRFKIGSYKVIIKNIFGITSSIRYNLFGFKLCFFQIFDSIDLSMKSSIINKNPPCKRGDFIFGQSPKRYWQRTSAFQIGLPAMQLLFTTHKWVPWIEQTYLIDFFISF